MQDSRCACGRSRRRCKETEAHSFGKKPKVLTPFFFVLYKKRERKIRRAWVGGKRKCRAAAACMRSASCFALRQIAATVPACLVPFACLYKKKGLPSRSMIHIHAFCHANRTFLRVLRVINGKNLKISQQSAFTFCVSLTSHHDTAVARGAPVGGGLEAAGRASGRIPNTDAVFASRPLAWRPLPFCRGGTGSGRQWRAGPAVSVSWWPPRRPDTGAWDSLRGDSATARDLRWRDDVRGSGVLCDRDRLTV